jgi:hypothetical protein
MDAPEFVKISISAHAAPVKREATIPLTSSLIPIGVQIGFTLC